MAAHDLSAAPDWGAAALDLDAYLTRIGYAGPRTVKVETLRALHRAHVAAIGFENVDVALGRDISLEPADLQNKLVHGGRGGYCFEHNLLFAAALERLGFPVNRLLARVRRGSSRIRYRAHALLLVTAEGRTWVADVGFGDEGLLEPIRFAAGETLTTGGWTWRLVPEADQWVLQSRRGEEWFDLYAFRLERHYPPDFDVSNHYTAHHPRSTFVGRLIAQRSDDGVRYALKDRELVLSYPDGRTELIALTGAQVVKTLRHVFGLRITPSDALLVQGRFAES